MKCLENQIFTVPHTVYKCGKNGSKYKLFNATNIYCIAHYMYVTQRMFWNETEKERLNNCNLKCEFLIVFTNLYVNKTKLFLSRFVLNLYVTQLNSTQLNNIKTLENCFSIVLHHVTVVYFVTDSYFTVNNVVYVKTRHCHLYLAIFNLRALS